MPERCERWRVKPGQFSNLGASFSLIFNGHRGEAVGDGHWKFPGGKVFETCEGRKG